MNGKWTVVRKGRCANLDENARDRLLVVRVRQVNIAAIADPIGRVAQLAEQLTLNQ